MSIKSDRWIREMAETKGMISPFEPGQIKENDGHKIVSYGTSSYGYDIRCADEFKLFTNLNTTIVDPKNFDEKNFVDVSGEGYCIIPPNSFALARTVEYFRIPRNVLTVCLGKSTYARCFSGDTKVALVGQPDMTFKEMASNPDAIYFGYTILPSGDMGIAQLYAPRLTGRDKLLAIELDNGEVINATPDHRFMLRTGEYVEAQSLNVDDSLMPLYRYGSDEHEKVYRPVSNTVVPTEELLSDCIQSRVNECLESIEELPEEAPTNHKVLSIKELPGIHDVYCLSVPEGQNFSLSAGVVVHNCGIIVNVTPFEPEWEGYVTLEFSNTTPLPAKIYANEGVAQVLFFEADEYDVCETSYKDRKGKYMGQSGVTLPKA
jgi:deoxycytidine triphosphate deaminase